MITRIEEQALARITSRIEALKAGRADKGAGTLLTANAVAVAVLKGSFDKVTPGKWRQDVTISVLVKFKNVASEEARRKGINPIMQAIVQLMAGEKLGLPIREIQPERWNDVTTQEQYDSGIIQYLAEFGTAFITEKQNDEAVDDLLTIGLSYTLKPGDDVVDASDLVTLGTGSADASPT